MAKIRLELRKMLNKEEDLEAVINRVLNEAIQKRIPLVEILPPAGNAHIKKQVLRFLAKPEMKKLYYKVERDADNYGRIFVHFRHKNDNAYHS